MIAITGASGQLGKSTLTFLLKKVSAQNIIAIVRDANEMKEFKDQGLQTRIADYTDPLSLTKALEGVTTLLQISSSAMGAEAMEHETNVVQAAIAQSVKHIVYTSTLHPSPGAHFLAAAVCMHTEDLIKSSGMRYTIFRNSMYLETVPLFVGNAMEDGQVYYPSEKGSVSFVSRIDIAEALSQVLTEEVSANRILKITGSESIGFADIANLLQDVMKLPAAFTYMPIAEYKAILDSIGMHPAEVDFYLSMARSIDSGEFQETDNALQNILNKKPLTLKEYFSNMVQTPV